MFKAPTSCQTGEQGRRNVKYDLEFPLPLWLLPPRGLDPAPFACHHPSCKLLIPSVALASSCRVREFIPPLVDFRVALVFRLSSFLFPSYSYPLSYLSSLWQPSKPTLNHSIACFFPSHSHLPFVSMFKVVLLPLVEQTGQIKQIM